MSREEITTAFIEVIQQSTEDHGDKQKLHRHCDEKEPADA